jgi:hypothetical protein
MVGSGGAGGSISANGQYTAPTNIGTDTIRVSCGELNADDIITIIARPRIRTLTIESSDGAAWELLPDDAQASPKDEAWKFTPLDIDTDYELLVQQFENS